VRGRRSVASGSSGYATVLGKQPDLSPLAASIGDRHPALRARCLV
jgi:hypothetical protein